jgi:hypothetical protein
MSIIGEAVFFIPDLKAGSVQGSRYLFVLLEKIDA